MSALPEVLETLVLGPEDKLVIVVPEHLTMAERDEAAQFADRFAPGRVLIIAGVEQLAVLRGEATAPEDGHRYACCGKIGRISRHESWCPERAS